MPEGGVYAPQKVSLHDMIFPPGFLRVKPAPTSDLEGKNAPDDVEVCDNVALVVPNKARTRPGRHLQNVHRKRVPLVDERADVDHAGRGLRVRGPRR